MGYYFVWKVVFKNFKDFEFPRCLKQTICLRKSQISEIIKSKELKNENHKVEVSKFPISNSIIPASTIAE